MQYLLKAAADVTVKDVFQNTCLNDAVRCRSVRQRMCYCPVVLGYLSAIGPCSHDNVASVLREHGAVLVFPRKQAGVLMCQVGLHQTLFHTQMYF